MTRKHFKRLALIVARIKDSNTMEQVMTDIAFFCREMNHNFDWERFKYAVQQEHANLYRRS
jgi:hypothetical protein